MDITPRRGRRKTAKDEQREHTRAKLIEAARRLFWKHGYDDVPVTEIAQEAGVTHSMINAYFGGKPGLLYEIVKANNAPQYDDSISIRDEAGPADQRLSKLLQSWARVDGSEPRMLAVMEGYSWVWTPQNEAENAVDRARFTRVIAEILDQGVTSGEFSLRGDTADAAAAIFAIFTWGLRGVIFDEKSPDDCHADIMRQVRLITGS
ncbi:TetR/AcrR family transcriptional regulator [Pseudooceanicola sp. LIPI14-2-Ac024]|uniref:TetR/AcrR family transcriptional regulator n=1 Tax=Pseudooceanicola sp. LIPI14-2-Ac024 TaxID=3344875 RepID=UPI0035CEDBE6